MKYYNRNPFTALIGEIYLDIFYRDKKEREHVLKKKFAGQINLVGSFVLLRIMAAAMILLLGTFLITVIYVIIRDNIFK